jgi:hypothetical protein
MKAATTAAIMPSRIDCLVILDLVRSTGVFRTARWSGYLREEARIGRRANHAMGDGNG